MTPAKRGRPGAEAAIASLGFAFCLCLVAVPTVSIAAKPLAQIEPLVLEPSSKWNVQYADDKCRLARMFGEDDQRVAFYIERYDPGDNFFLLIAGKPLKEFRLDRTKVVFGPGGTETKYPPMPGSLEDMPALMFTSTTLLPLAEEPKEQDVKHAGSKYRPDADNGADNNVLGQELTAAQEATIVWLEASAPRRQPVRLNLGSMGPPMAAMRTCIDELVGHWGIDVEAHRSLLRAVEPLTSPGTWITSNDYPTEQLRKGDRGIVHFRLIIGTDGRPLECRVQESTRPAEFDAAVCAAMKRKARFKPALDKSGKPIKSYWRSSVRFDIPG